MAHTLFDKLFGCPEEKAPDDAMPETPTVKVAAPAAGGAIGKVTAWSEEAARMSLQRRMQNALNQHPSPVGAMPVPPGQQYMYVGPSGAYISGNGGQNFQKVDPAPTRDDVGDKLKQRLEEMEAENKVAGVIAQAITEGLKDAPEGVTLNLTVNVSIAAPTGLNSKVLIARDDSLMEQVRSLVDEELRREKKV